MLNNLSDHQLYPAATVCVRATSDTSVGNEPTITTLPLGHTHTQTNCCRLTVHSLVAITATTANPSSSLSLPQFSTFLLSLFCPSLRPICIACVCPDHTTTTTRLLSDVWLWWCSAVQVNTKFLSVFVALFMGKCVCVLSCKVKNRV